MECKYYKDIWQSQKTSETKGKYKECTPNLKMTVLNTLRSLIFQHNKCYGRRNMSMIVPAGIWNFYNDNGQLTVSDGL